ncbi:FAD-dependent oxidoreductase [Bifidobacterium eulemuris]|uniref:FAD-dependent oxidoreductase n=1 Tax=Bifidobacterium eulemuris TaxID=1765219 RepID=A0A261GBW5_9BIFI|nr:FAD-dependent oxidoreductase [Bifidobacterium eulemuris]OZG68931.1 thioredoxin reductase [Bifidobacterium eulemuris]QOL31531.1 FAD-dependent oxidoreductase [Bifidobacterium eulemuris]
MDTKDLYDVVVIGGGPAGLTAGLYLARARYRVLIVEKDDFGGQITITDEVVNYPGVGVTSGKALTATMRRQAADFGAEFLSAEVTGLDLDGDVKTVRTTRGDLRCFGVLVATGASPRKLGFAGEAEYAGRGVAYCATCDGEFFTGREVLVIGGGFAAAEEAVFLTKYASKVTMLIREEDFTCDASVAAGAKSNPKIEIHYETVLDGVSAGSGGLREATLRSVATGETRTWKPADDGTFGVFVFAGYVPATALVRGLVELDEQGYVVTDQFGRTSVDGVYAAGDLRQKHLRQVVTATADGAIAAVELERHAKECSERTGLVPPRPTQSVYEQQEAAAAAQAPAGTTPSPAPVKRSADKAAAKKPGELFNDNVKAQLSMVFGKMARSVTLLLELDDTPLSRELEGFVGQMAALSDGKIAVRVSDVAGELDGDGRTVFDASVPLPPARPCVRVCAAGEDGEPKPTGLAFHGVPSGHEFNSFVLGIYNASGLGQQLDADLDARIAGLDKSVDVTLLVSLTCTMCPDTVLAAQRIAAGNPRVTAEAYDISHFPELKEHYGVMSVPCIVIDREGEPQRIEFGKKSVAQMLDLIGA